MAGIGISARRDWIVARWLSDFLVEKVLDIISPTSRTVERLQRSRADGTAFSTLADLTTIERKSFYNAVGQVYAEAQAVGPSLLTTPEAFPGFMKHVEELIELMAGEWPDVIGT